jgi:hypothetical protein
LSLRTIAPTRAPLAVALALAFACATGCETSTSGMLASGDGGAPGDGGESHGPVVRGDGAAGDGASTFSVTLCTLDTSQYLSATGGGGGALDAAAVYPTSAETFTLSDLNGGALLDGDPVRLAAADGHYVSAAGGGGSTLAADVVTPGDDETFVIARVAGPGPIAPGDDVAFKTMLKVNYISAIDGGGGDVRADAPWAKAWETFTIAVDGAASSGPSSARQQVLAFIASIDGQKTIAGQHNKINATPAISTSDVASITGKTPALWSADFGFGQDALDHRALMITEAINQWHHGAIVQLMYHNCVPTGDETCDWDAIGGNSPQHLTDAEWSELVTDGTALNTAWKARLDKLSVFFKQLKDAGVAPLFRPLHEMNQSVFWWGGRGGADGTRKLYQLTHDYLVKVKGFNHIIWVWDLQDFSSLSTDTTDYDPGSAYYDIAALDVYDGGYDQSKHDLIRAAAGAAPIAIGECEILPTSAELVQQPDWVFFMLWPDFVGEETSVLPALYSAANVITEDKMPGWK